MERGRAAGGFADPHADRPRHVPPHPPRTRRRMIVCEQVTKSYPMGRGRKHVLKGVDLQIRPGSHVGCLGRNGAGKTTLIKLLGGVEMPTSGNVRRQMSVSWPLGFGGGFQGSLTGYDNARFISRIYGHDYSE